MKEFKYIYLDDSNREIKGFMEAENANELAITLKSYGYKVISIEEISKNTLNLDIGEFIFGIPREEVITFTIQLATMLEAGMTILGALDVLMDQVSKKSFRDIIRELRRDVASGTKLSDALARHQKVFNDLYVSMVKVGETTGMLDKVLNRLAEFMEAEEELKSNIKTAMSYPVFLIIVAIGVIFFLLSFVLPKFINIFNSFNIPLPKITRILLALSAFFSMYWLHMIVIVFGIGFAVYLFLKTEAGGWFMDRLILRLPLISTVIIKSNIARFSNTLATLILIGVPIIRSLEITSSVMGNRVYSKYIGKAIDKVNSGKKLSEGITNRVLFPPLLVRMLAVGENTGTTENMLIKVKQFYERDVKKAVKAMISAIEPLLIFFIAFIVGFIVLSVMIPLLDMSRLIKH